MGKLIRLELFNFKSYRGHHTLLFGDSYFTSIIGPNGSGKSNSMDAISFVLGIKSSHLRSTHLRDLIYRGRILKTSKINADGTATNGQVNGGTGSDNEQGQTSSSQRNDPHTAWVMAVYEDDAGEEQRWKRTITSQGQSEYRINNRVVNAKQYNEALEAENILIKARNFLVFQGDVEAIASQSPKDLTRLIEQISGSLEYKADYDRLSEESEKAAEEQTFKLNQRRAINAEIKQYSEQKKEADNFNKKVDERDQAVITHVLWKLHHFQRLIEESGAEIQRHQDELKEHRRNVEKYEQRLDEAKKEQVKVGREMSKIERHIKTAEKNMADKQNSMLPIDEKITISNKNLEKYQKRVAEISKEHASQSRSIDQIQKDLGTVQKAQGKWEEEWKKLAKKEGRQLSDADLQEYERLRADVNKRTATAQIKVDNLTRQRKTDEETVNSLKSKVEEHQQHVKKVEGELQGLNERRDTAASQIKQTTKEIETKKKEYNSLTSDRLRKAQRHTELEEKLQEVLNKLLEADSGRRQNEKEARAKETILAMKRIFPGVRGRVHELCKPKQKKYETAVSTVLGRHFDAVVVESEKTAKDCIAYLREQRLGQATFIPLDTIQVKAANANLKGMHKNMRLALDTIEYDHSVERAMSYACGNSMICDDLSTAKYLCFEKNVEAKAVTLDGTVIHKGGLMTGGRGPNDRNTRKWEDAEVDNLHKLRDKLLADLAALPTSHKSLSAEEALQSELSGLEQGLAHARDESKALEKNIESKKKELKFVQAQLKEAQPKYQQQSNALQSVIKQIDENQGEISSVEDEVFAAFCQQLKYDSIRAYETQQGSLQQEGAQKKLEFSMQRNKLEHQLTFEKQRLESTANRMKALEDQKQRDKDLISSLEAEQSAIQEELDETEAKLAELNQKLEQHREKHGQRSETVGDLRREVQKRNKDAEFVLKTITGLETEMQRTAASRYALLRKCKIDEVKIPLAEDSRTLDSLPVDDLLTAERDPEAMDVDDEPDASSTQGLQVQDYGIVVDFDHLDDELKEDDSPAQETSLQAAITALTSELSSLNPNMRAMERLATANERLNATTDSFEAARNTARETREAFEAVREQRAALFNKAFEHISEQIGPVYKSLTRSANFPTGGQAYLDTMGADDDTPFDGGLKYHAMPPLKRFRDMDALSGGEKTIAALALLFAVHSFAPSPFFVLDEVDAALDNANVAKVAKYIKEHAGPGMQFIVISLKTGLFQESECLVGVLRDQGANSSRTVTLDLRKYQPT